MSYLTFDEYVNMGGTLEETSFNSFALDADSYIDWYTFNRLWNEEEIPERVKQCEFQLIKLLKTKADLLVPDVSSTAGINPSAQVMSQSNDGVSTEYSVLHADVVFTEIKSEIENIIQRYLSGVMNSLGRRLLYRGLYPGE